jgi:hypothetical protein
LGVVSASTIKSDNELLHTKGGIGMTPQQAIELLEKYGTLLPTWLEFDVMTALKSVVEKHKEEL